jgi:hypothetical protein
MTDRDLTATDGIREWRDPDGVRWQVWSGGRVKWWHVGGNEWLDSQWTVAELEAHPEICEVTPVGGDVS